MTVMGVCLPGLRHETDGIVVGALILGRWEWCLVLGHGIVLLLRQIVRGAWVGQSVERLTSAQVMISQSVSLSPALSSVLTPQNLEPILDSVSLFLSLLLPCLHYVSQK